MISIGSYEIKKNHLLVIGILVLAVSISFLIRIQPMQYGYELNEFDPFFNYRATQYLVDNGFSEYFNWHDTLSWHPAGRDVSYDSQITLHIIAASTYWVFGANGDLYDFTVMFPVIFGSLTAIVVFALVRVIGGTTAGLFSALLFSISMPILLRGTIGWFKSEPLGLFFGILAIYLFLSGLNSKNNKIALAKLIPAGILLVLGISAWGGLQFFFIPLTIFIISLPFFRKDHKFLLWAIPLFTASTLFTSLSIERLSTDFITGLEGITLISSNLFLIALIFIQNKNQKNKRRNGLAFLIAISIIASLFLVINSDSQFVNIPNHRYLNAINPFLTTTDPLVDSVSEHTTTTIDQSFYFLSSLMIFSAIGIWILLTKQNNRYTLKNDMIAFSLILGLIGVYTSSAFIRLELFASISVIILSSIGLYVLSNKFLINYQKNRLQYFVKPCFVIGIIILLVIPLIIPSTNWVSGLIIPPTIMNGGSLYDTSTNDWLHAMEWMKNNTPSDAVIASWWDYGYWIQTLGERTTLADNATLSTSIIANIAKMFLSDSDTSWKMLNDLDADYLLVFVAAERLETDSAQRFYLLDGGGDESKKHWIMRIAGDSVGKYLHSDGSSGNDHFWQNTVLGQTIPFSPFVYINSDQTLQSENFQPGFFPIYVENIQFPEESNGPLRLVYASPSFYANEPGPMIGVFIYEVNKEYIPLR